MDGWVSRTAQLARYTFLSIYQSLSSEYMYINLYLYSTYLPTCVVVDGVHKAGEVERHVEVVGLAAIGDAVRGAEEPLMKSHVARVDLIKVKGSG